MHAIRDGFVRWKDFGGCSTVSEYWYFILFEFVILFIVGILNETLFHYQSLELFLLFILPIYIFILVLIIPTIALSIRRLHDSNHSGWNLLWYLLPYLGILYLVYLCCLPSKRNFNNHYWRDWCQYEMIKRSTEKKYRV